MCNCTVTLITCQGKSLRDVFRAGPSPLGDGKNLSLDRNHQFRYITVWLYTLLAMEHLDATFAALADPTRRAILARLAKGEASVTDLAQPFAMSQPAISKHLKVLERAGLISRGRDAQR